MQEQINFLRNVEQLSHLSKRILNRIYYSIKLKKFKRKQILIKEGDVPQFIFIVKEGELEVRKNVYEMRNANEEYDLL